MTKRCFSNSQLYALRNDINVQMLIEKTLRIPCRVTKGCFRFLCPLCNAFDTAVNPKTNLARCFRCEKNFNTIDLVMLIRQANFVQSVKFLQPMLQKDYVGQARGDLKTISANNLQGGCQMKLKAPAGKSDDGPCHIAKSLDGVLPQKHGVIAEKCLAEPKPSKPVAARLNADEHRIVKLERQLECLGRQIEKIARTINLGLPAK